MLLLFPPDNTRRASDPRPFWSEPLTKMGRALKQALPKPNNERLLPATYFCWLGHL
jgi:hypothetical protein